VIGAWPEHNSRLIVLAMVGTSCLSSTVGKIMIDLSPAEIALGLGLGLVVGGFGASWESTTVKGKVISLTLVIAGIGLLAFLLVLKPGAGLKS
jgi:putative effector of murein hydrolase